MTVATKSGYVMQVRLSRAALCLDADCETIFPLNLSACPACGGTTVTTLALFLSGDRRGRAA